MAKLNKEFEINNIPSVIVDAHHEVFAFWYNMFHKESVDLVHVDAHHDLFTHAKPFKDDLDSYVSSLMIGDFIVPAVYEGFVNSVYWVEPLVKDIKISLYEKPEFYLNNGVIREHNYDFFRTNLPVIDIAASANQINNSPRQYILDIDLDGFDLIDDRLTEDDVENNIKNVFDMLGTLKTPSYISIARSQSPNPFVDPGKVDGLQSKVIEQLKRTYM